MKNLQILDGAMGTMLQSIGIFADPVTANVTHPQAVTDLHIAYLQAGADIITANTFGAYGHKHVGYAQLTEAALCNAANATKNFVNKQIALDIGPTGLTLEPYGGTTTSEVAHIFASTIEYGVKNGADLILIETMMDANELEIAVIEAKKTALPVFASMSFGTNGRTMYGASIQSMVELLERLQVDALGLNCGEGLEPYASLVDELLATTKVPIIFQPNAGLPDIIDGQPVYSVAPSQFAGFMAQQAGKGVAILGGCCGTSPAHIQEMVEHINSRCKA